MEFNVGDRVIIHKPDNGRKNFPDEPTWVPSMDEYDGTEQCISSISNIRHGGKWIRLVGQGWSYGSSWLSPVPEFDEEFEAEDLTCLM